MDLILSNSEIKDYLKRMYSMNHHFKTDYGSLVVDPFKVLQFNEILTDEDYSSLYECVLSLTYERKLNDLYSLKQSKDLSTDKNQVLRKFLKYLNRHIKPLLEFIVGYSFEGGISSTASKYEKGDVLLCHDDRCQDRCVAFVYYLTTSQAVDGGSFDMFDHDDEGQPTGVVHSIVPKANSFICFEVGNYSHHQVSEVLSEDHKRLSINGWFHSTKALSIKPIPFKEKPLLKKQFHLKGLVMLDEFIKTAHTTPTYIEQARQAFLNQSHILFENFLTKPVFNKCTEQFKLNSIKWIPFGPPNRRKYDVADVDSLPEYLLGLRQFFMSSLFVAYLSNITGLTFKEPSGGKSGSSLKFEIQRWKQGNYTLSTNDTFFDRDGLDLYLFFNCKSTDYYQVGGFRTYLATDPEEGEDSELLSIGPQNNALCLVYRTSDTVCFTKYMSYNYKEEYYCICATYYE